MIYDGNTENIPKNLRNGDIVNFEYCGEVKSITLAKGKYQINAWGGMGGCYNLDNIPGYGGFATGTLILSKETTLYVCVGGQGEWRADGITGYYAYCPGGYNGGGAGAGWMDNKCCGGGGGATHLALVSGQLKDLEPDKDKVIIVAGGGGGTGWMRGWPATSIGGAGGGAQGGKAFNDGWWNDSIATQTSGSAFGLGQTGGGNCSGGGAGWYGGYTKFGAGGAGTGGSGWINHPYLFDAHMSGFNIPEDLSPEAYTISVSESSEAPEFDKAKFGNGFLRIIPQIQVYFLVKDNGKIKYWDDTTNTWKRLDITK